MRGNNRQTRVDSLTEGAVLPVLLRFTFPIFCSMLLQAAYGAVDIYVVGQYAPNAHVAAVGAAGNVVTMIMNFITGLVTGVTVLVGNRVGAGENEKAARAVGASVYMGALVSVVLGGIPWAFAEQISRALHVPEEAFAPCVQYLSICSVGCVFTVAYNLISAVFRAVGNSRMPLLFVGIACVVNVVGDVVLVAGFHLGAAGAAIATVLAQALSVAFSLWYWSRGGLPFRVTGRMLRFDREDVGTMLRLGVPIGFQTSITTFSFLVLSSVVNVRGLAASSGYGIGQKIMVFVSLPLKAYSPALAAVVAQNRGAGKPERAREALRAGIVSAFVISAAIFAAAWVFAYRAAGLFVDDPETIRAAEDFVRGFSIDNLIGCVVFCLTGYLNGMGRSGIVMVQGLVTSFAVRAPAALLIGTLPGTTLFHLGLACPLASCAGAAVYLLYCRRLWREERTGGLPEARGK